MRVRRGKFCKLLHACGAVVRVLCCCRWTSDEKKIAFTIAALDSPDPFKNTTELNGDVVSAIEWQASKTDAEIYQFREALLTGCEAAGAEMLKNGVCDAWFAECRDEIKMVL